MADDDEFVPGIQTIASVGLQETSPKRIWGFHMNAASGEVDGLKWEFSSGFGMGSLGLFVRVTDADTDKTLLSMDGSFHDALQVILAAAIEEAKTRKAAAT